MMREQTAPAGTGNYIAADILGGGFPALAVAPPAPALKTRTKRVGFQVISGSSAGVLDALRAGAGGAMLPFSACAPQACYEVYAAWRDDDGPLAAEKQSRIELAAKLIEGDLGVPAIKAACDLNGYFGGQPRMPILPVSGAERQKIEQLMNGLRS